MKERREKEEERKQDGTCSPGRELKMRRSSHIWEIPLTGGKINWDRKGALGAQRRTQQLVGGRQDRLRPIQVVHASALCTPDSDRCPQVCTVAGCWNVGFGEQTG